VARMSADFDELYAELNPPVTTPALDATLIITPLLCFRIELRMGNVTVIGPRTLTVINLHHSAGFVYANGPRRLAPALFTRIVTGPRIFSAWVF